MKFSNLESQFKISEENSIFHFLYNKIKEGFEENLHLPSILLNSNNIQNPEHRQQDMQSHHLASAFQIISHQHI